MSADAQLSSGLGPYRWSAALAQQNTIAPTHASSAMYWQRASTDPLLRAMANPRLIPEGELYIQRCCQTMTLPAAERRRTFPGSLLR
jgi:hypothetical protein